MKVVGWKGNSQPPFCGMDSYSPVNQSNTNLSAAVKEFYKCIQSLKWALIEHNGQNNF